MGHHNFDESLLEVYINNQAVKQAALDLKETLKISNNDCKIRDLLFAINCIDLTTLGGDDTASNVARLCWRATNPLSKTIVDRLIQLNYKPVSTAAVCVYPLRVSDCQVSLSKFNANLSIASVVTGFPAGQGEPNCTLAEIKFATKSGANEIDIVINRTLVLTGQWHKLYLEIREIVQICEECNAHLKVILSYGELGTLENVYKASMCAMMAGADFIKTSTGKESINAKLVFGLIMTRAIRDYYWQTGRKVGLKPAGGLKDANDALCWVTLIRSQLGPEWMSNQLFRIGASSMLTNIEAEMFNLLFSKKPNKYQLSF